MRVNDTPIAYSYISISSNKVGSWRFVEPYLEKKIPQCQNACPIQQNIREVLDLLAKDQEEQAFEKMVEKNPLLYATGTVCPHFCQKECNRAKIEEAIGIGNIEAYLGKKWITKKLDFLKKQTNSSYRVAIIGAGPAGLSLAFQLACYGIRIDLFEKEEKPGGMLYYGIPDSRLDKKLIIQEIERILNNFPHISLFTRQKIDYPAVLSMKKNYDQIFLAAGLPLPVLSHFSAVEYGIEVLQNYHKKQYQFPQNGSFLVLGGGNTAMDVAHYLRENNNQVQILVRKSKKEMKAFEEEIQWVEESGAVICENTELVDWDPLQKKATIRQKENIQTIYCDGVFVCFGQRKEEEWQGKEDSIVLIGDITGKNATLSHAIADGYKAARDFLIEKKIIVNKEENYSLVNSEEINWDYWKKKKQKSQKDLKEEAQRCLQCGSCTACQVCEIFCPDFAICVEDQAQFNLDYCKGCEICYTECPRNAISIREVKK